MLNQWAPHFDLLFPFPALLPVLCLSCQASPMIILFQSFHQQCPKPPMNQSAKIMSHYCNFQSYFEYSHANPASSYLKNSQSFGSLRYYWDHRSFSHSYRLLNSCYFQILYLGKLLFISRSVWTVTLQFWSIWRLWHIIFDLKISCHQRNLIPWSLAQQYYQQESKAYEWQLASILTWDRPT